MTDTNALALATVAATTVPSFFLLALPSTAVVQAECADPRRAPAMMQTVRAAYFPAALLSVGLGGLLSYLTKSPLPVVMATGATGLLIGLYEQAMPVSMPDCLYLT